MLTLQQLNAVRITGIDCLYSCRPTAVAVAAAAAEVAPTPAPTPAAAEGPVAVGVGVGVVLIGAHQASLVQWALWLKGSSSSWPLMQQQQQQQARHHHQHQHQRWQQQGHPARALAGARRLPT